MKLFALRVLAAIIVVKGGVCQVTLSPLCDKCSCAIVDKNGTATADVDCSDKIVTYDFLHNASHWSYGDKNTPFAIGKVDFRASDIGDLKKQLPHSSLTHLDLSYNFVRDIDDDFFAQLQDMRVLVLSHNEIERLKPDAFRGLRMDGDDYPLKSLTTLKLDNNRFHTLNQDLFQHVEERLEVLDISYNPLKVIDQQTMIAIGSLIYLKELYLSFTKIHELPEHFTHTPKYLRVLDLSGNNFGAVPRTLNDSHALEVLHFNNNPIGNLTTETGFPTITTLKVLHMCDMLELETIGKGSLSGLVNLEELHVANNIKLTYFDSEALTVKEVDNEIWPPLKKLHLQNNELTYIDFHLVLHWEHLVELDLRYNPWTCECENQWIIDVLFPIYLQINATQAKELRCEAPIEMQGITFYNEYVQNKSMRCLDMYGHRPEKDAGILIGVLIGLLAGIPIILFIIFAYQRHWFGLFDNSPAAFSRQFYSRTRAEEL